MHDPLLTRLQVLSDAGFLPLDDSNVTGSGPALQRKIEAYSRHAHEAALVKAVLVAGLFPNVALARQKKFGSKVSTREDGGKGIVFHPSSVLNNVRKCVTSISRHTNNSLCGLSLSLSITC